MVNYLIALLLACAHLHGLATYYGPPAFLPGDTMANGEGLRLNAPTVAVDVSLQPLLNREAIVLTECGTLHKVKITDTGRLYKAGEFKHGIRDGQKRYYPVNTETKSEPVLLNEPYPATEWLDDNVYRVVADFPSEYFASIACRVDHWGKGDTMKVWVWVMNEDN